MIVELLKEKQNKDSDIIDPIELLAIRLHASVKLMMIEMTIFYGKVELEKLNDIVGKAIEEITRLRKEREK